MLEGKTVLLGVTGGIAAYKAADLCSKLVKQHADVNVVMTKNATEFISPRVFDSLTGRRTVTDTFDRNHEFHVGHIALAESSDLVLIAPATANVLAKLAHGIADDMLTTTVLACDCIKMAAPAMNTRMYENPVTQDNLAALRRYGWKLIEPDSGHLACGATGKGKLPDPQVILSWVIRELSHEKDMTGLKVLVTAGPTCEAIDPVRCITNHSTGKMGYAVASAAASRGADVTLVSGPVSIDRPVGVRIVDVVTARDMFEAVTAVSGEQDLIVKAAAVADYRPVEAASDKIKKKDENLSIALERTDDILAYLGGHRRKGQIICGFSMETRDLIENSRRKLEKKHVDLIAANNVRDEGAGFGTETNRITLISENSETHLPLMSKWEAANCLLDRMMEMRKA
ncbi:MAG: bifunctional phosphopantothenoylcysteine decarboxylase/phosphopantothenate--cysteine ligase CoaBC [Lachnospiraceae bacterium]|jgi:phosphopantothenoylcysteine decarboxylase/phosphopantothenate--cysteine ligase|nr:bifunctional phosphopantothenoylcysteine decarboxylase/phosphopantothenate--cysteine ligase CoaBC [Lachnospiraceae bacterium]